MNLVLIIISLILNGILLMYLFGVVPFFLFLSLLLNAGMTWYIRGLFTSITESNEDLQEILETTANLGNHLEEIHGLEMYYGDETLLKLIQHTNEVVEELTYYGRKHSLIDEDDEEEITEEEYYDPAEDETSQPIFNEE